MRDTEKVRKRNAERAQQLAFLLFFTALSASNKSWLLARMKSSLRLQMRKNAEGPAPMTQSFPNEIMFPSWPATLGGGIGLPSASETCHGQKLTSKWQIYGSHRHSSTVKGKTASPKLLLRKKRWTQKDWVWAGEVKKNEVRSPESMSWFP